MAPAATLHPPDLSWRETFVERFGVVSMEMPLRGLSSVTPLKRCPVTFTVSQWL
jgi:hypothetical protein